MIPASLIDLNESVRLCVAFVFGVAGGSKLLQFDTFAAGIRMQGVVPSRLARSAAAGVVLAEIGIATLLILHVFERLASFAALSLIVLFGVVQLLILRRGVSAPCLCLNPASGDVVSARTLFRLALLGVATVMLVAMDAAASGSGVSAQEFSSVPIAAVNSAAFAALLLCAGFWLSVAPEIWSMHKSCETCASHSSRRQ